MAVNSVMARSNQPGCVLSKEVMDMNIRFLSLPLAVTALLALAGCASPTVVTLQNGTQYLTEDTPNTRTADGFYEFEDISGRKVRVRADEVATIRKED
jgi:hypothetical protein